MERGVGLRFGAGYSVILRASLESQCSNASEKLAFLFFISRTFKQSLMTAYEKQKAA